MNVSGMMRDMRAAWQHLSLGLLLGLICTGIMIAAAYAGMTPRQVFSSLAVCGPAVMLLFFWGTAGAVLTLAVCWLNDAMRAPATQAVVAPWYRREELLYLTPLVTVCLAISAATMPANIIKLFVFQGMVCLLAGYVLWRRGWTDCGKSVLLPVAMLVYAAVFVHALTIGRAASTGTLVVRCGFYLLWFVVASCLLSQERRERAVEVLLTVGGLTGFYGCLQYAGLDPAGWGHEFSLPELAVEHRAMGTFGNPNFLGVFTLLVLPLGVRAILGAAPGREKWWATARTVFTGLGLLFSFNRAAYLGFFIGLTVLLWRVEIAGLRRRGMQLAGALLLVMLAITPVRERLWLSVTSLSGDDSLRLALWEACGRMIAQHPLAGTGMGDFNQQLTGNLGERFFALYPAPKYIIEHAHSEVLELAIEGGLPLVIIVAYALWLTGRCLYGGAVRTVALERAVLAALAGVLVHACFETKLRYESTMVPLLLLLGLCFPAVPAAGKRSRIRSWQWLIGGALLGYLTLTGVVLLQGNMLLKDELDLTLQGDASGALVAARKTVEILPEDLQANYRLLLWSTATNHPLPLPEPVVRVLSGDGVRYQDTALLLARWYLLQQQPAAALPLALQYARDYPADNQGHRMVIDCLLAGNRPLALLERLDRRDNLPGGREERIRYLTAGAIAWHGLGDTDAGNKLMAQVYSLDAGYAPPRLNLTPEFSPLQGTDAVAARHALQGLLQRYRQGLPPALKEEIERWANRLLGNAATRHLLLPLGDALAECRQFEQAEILYRSAGADDRMTSERLLWLSLRTGAYRTSCQLAETLANRWPETTGYRYLLARATEATDKTRARALYRQVLARHPDHPGAVAGLQRLQAAPAIRDGETILCDADPRWSLRLRFSGTDTPARVSMVANFALLPDPVWYFVAYDARGGVFVWPEQPAAAGTREFTLPVVLTDSRMPSDTLWVEVHSRAWSILDGRDGSRMAVDTYPSLAAAPLVVRPPAATTEALSGNRVADTVPARIDSVFGPAVRLFTPRAWQPVVLRQFAVLFEPAAVRERRLHPEPYDPQRWLAWERLAVAVWSDEELPFLFEMANRNALSSATAALAFLERLTRCGVQEIPGALWQRPARQGCRDAYWRRWYGTASARHAGFAAAIGGELCRREEWSELAELLRDFPAGTAPELDYLHAAVQFHDGDRDAAGARMAVRADDPLPVLWWKCRWLHRYAGLPEDVRDLLRAGGADGMYRALSPSGTAREYEGGIWLLDARWEKASGYAGDTVALEADLMLTDLSAAPDLRLDAMLAIPGGSRAAAAEWIPPEQLRRAPGAVLPVRLTLRIPAGTPPGAYACMLWLNQDENGNLFWPYLPLDGRREGLFGGREVARVTVLPDYYRFLKPTL